MKECFSKIDIFSQCSAEDIAIMEKHSRFKTFAEGEAISKQGEIRGELFFVVSGKVKVTLKLPGAIERKLGEHSPGSFFGETSVFGKKPLHDTYIAAEECGILIISEKAFTELTEKSPADATKLIYALLSRTINEFRRTSRFLADVVQWGENASRRVITDEQTGIYNRTFLNDALESFFNISKSNSKPLSLLMLDLDNCRKINETIGHDTGNIIINEFALIIKNAVSRHGIVARYGGDEFSVLLPETDLGKATAIAEEIRLTVESRDFSEILRGSGIRVTTSIGISSFPETADDLQSFKAKADASLYRAKELGRNRVVSVK